MTDQEMKTLLKAQQGELDAVLMYKALSEAVRDEKDKKTFMQLSSEEGHHASIFKGLTNTVLKPRKTLATFVPMAYKLIGKKKLYPIIAKFEYDAVNTYMPVVERFPEVESVKNDEKRHGDTVLALLE